MFIVFSQLFLLAIVIALLIISSKMPVQKDKLILRASAAAVGLLLVLFVIGSVTTMVNAKNVGVIHAFGKVSKNTLRPGLHLKAPWQKVIEIDGTIQTDEYKDKDAIYVRIGDGSRATVTLTSRWSVNPEHANTVYEDFRSDDPTQHFAKGFISTQLKAATQEVFEEYNPLGQLKPVDSGDLQNISFSPNFAKMSAEVQAELERRIRKDGNLANLNSVTISYFEMSKSTQKKINEYVAAVGDTRIALQREHTAKAESAANKALSASISNDPNVLVSKCLDIVSTSIEKKAELPAGFSCWGSGGSVVIPAK